MVSWWGGHSNSLCLCPSHQLTCSEKREELSGSGRYRKMVFEGDKAV